MNPWNIHLDHKAEFSKVKVLDIELYQEPYYIFQLIGIIPFVMMKCQVYLFFNIELI